MIDNLGTPTFNLTPTLACSKGTTADRTMLVTWLTYWIVSGSVARTSHVCHSCTRTGSAITGMPSWVSCLDLWLALVAPTHLCLTKPPWCCENEDHAIGPNPIKVTMLRAGVTIQVTWDAFQNQMMPPVISPVDCPFSGHFTCMTRRGNTFKTQDKGQRVSKASTGHWGQPFQYIWRSFIVTTQRPTRTFRRYSSLTYC